MEDDQFRDLEIVKTKTTPSLATGLFIVLFKLDRFSSCLPVALSSSILATPSPQ